MERENVNHGAPAPGLSAEQQKLAQLMLNLAEAFAKHGQVLGEMRRAHNKLAKQVAEIKQVMEAAGVRKIEPPAEPSVN